MLSPGMWRPDWTRRDWSMRPSGGWHLVVETRRWHLYTFASLPFWIAEGFAVERACDNARAEQRRMPKLVHADDLAPARDECVCASCWREWERVLALPTCGSQIWASYSVEPDPSQPPCLPSEAPWRPQHMPAGLPTPAFTGSGGWT